MKFSVSQSSLDIALSVVLKGLATNSTQPVLTGIYIKAEEGTLTLQTTDLTVSIRHKIPAQIEEAGETVVSGKMLSNIVKNLPDAAVSFESSDQMLLMTCNRSKYNLHTLDAEEFPAFPSFELQKSLELPSELLAQMVNKVYRVTSKDTQRAILQGIQTVVDNNTIRLVATDSYRLAVCDTHVETDAEEFSAIIPGSTFHEVLSLPTMTDNIMLGITDNQIVFSFGTTTFISRRIEGTFPNYKQLIASSYNTRLTLSTSIFNAALKRVSALATTTPSIRFDVDVEAGMLQLTASSPEQGEAHEALTIEAEGDNVEIGLNPRLVADCLSAVGDDEALSLELEGSMRPAVFKSYGAINYLYLLMPSRL